MNLRNLLGVRGSESGTHTEQFDRELGDSDVPELHPELKSMMDAGVDAGFTPLIETMAVIWANPDKYYGGDFHELCHPNLNSRDRLLIRTMFAFGIIYRQQYPEEHRDDWSNQTDDLNGDSNE